MPKLGHIDDLVAKAEEMIELALGAISNTSGSERGKLFASLANLYVDMARFEHEVHVEDRLVRGQQHLRERVKHIEWRLGVRDYPETPDPFAEIPIEDRVEEDPGDEGFDRRGIKRWERDIPTGGI